MRAKAPNTSRATRHASTTARQVAQTLLGAQPGHAHVTSTGLEWEVVIPAARGEYIATITLHDTPDDDHRSLDVQITGAWNGAEGRFTLPGGYSEVFDFGESVKINHASLARHIVESISQFEANSPALALTAARMP